MPVPLMWSRTFQAVGWVNFAGILGKFAYLIAYKPSYCFNHHAIGKA
jgi:hypothetical protein